MVKINIQYQNQFQKWVHFQIKHHEADAYRTAKSRASRTGLRHRLVNEEGQLLDLVEP